MSTSARDFPILSRLLSANEQWSKDVMKVKPGFFEEMAKGQHPKVLWIGCSDSRAPESVLCAVPPGEIFVTRNVANQFLPNDDSANSVLAYAVDHVGVEHVIVKGHTHCGGAVASLKIASSTPQTNDQIADTALSRWLNPIVILAKSLLAKDPKADVQLLVEENIKQQVTNVCNSPTIQAAWKAGKKVYVHGWLLSIETGRLSDLGISRGPESFGQ